LPQRSASGSMMTEMLLDREASYRLAAIRFRIPRGISPKRRCSNRVPRRAKHHGDMIGRTRVNAATGLMRRTAIQTERDPAGSRPLGSLAWGPLAANVLACSRARARGRLHV